MAFRARKKVVPEVAAADELLADGRDREAIDLLTKANRDHADAKIAHRLVEIRFDAFDRVGPTEPAPVWPPEVPDLFEGAGGPPEIGRAELTVANLQSAIFHHGSVIVRELLDPPTIARLKDDIDRAFSAHDAWAGMRRPRSLDWFTPLPHYGAEHRTFAREADGLLAVESPPAFCDIVDLFEELGIRDLATEFLGEPPVLLANKWTLRRVRPDAGNPDWHQDGAFMGADIRSLDVWLALSDCGEDAPGLDLVPRRLDHVVETGTEGAFMDWTVGHGLAERVAEGNVVTPVFRAGDAMLFDHLCLHRTAVYPGMTRERYAIEAWFAAPSSYPPGQMPIAY